MLTTDKISEFFCICDVFIKEFHAETMKIDANPWLALSGIFFIGVIFCANRNILVINRLFVIVDTVENKENRLFPICHLYDHLYELAHLGLLVILCALPKCFS